VKERNEGEMSRPGGMNNMEAGLAGFHSVWTGEKKSGDCSVA
jgi:hypothetical protein